MPESPPVCTRGGAGGFSRERTSRSRPTRDIARGRKEDRFRARREGSAAAGAPAGRVRAVRKEERGRRTQRAYREESRRPRITFFVTPHPSASRSRRMGERK